MEEPPKKDALSSDLLEGNLEQSSKYLVYHSGHVIGS